MPTESHRKALILASTSPYRRQLLERLGVPFDVVAPEIDETAQPGEAPGALAARLADDKARAVARRFPGAVVIGSDQVPVHDGRIIGKPGTPDRARRQLASFSGRRVVFLSAFSLHRRADGFRHEGIVETEVVFRELTDEEIRRYVERDLPVDCAGAFRSEATGSALVRAMNSSDPTAIIGLPLIAVSEGLRKAGLSVP
jgi:septum formation protein